MMLDRKAWESSIGCTYRMRNGDLVTVRSVGESRVAVKGDRGFLAVDLQGIFLTDPTFDIMEMVRTSNMPKSSGQSCG
jgi:hypothetical protein